ALERQLAELAVRQQWIMDRQAIHDLLCRYSRALDRLDIDLLRRAFWPDARVDLGPGLYQGEASQLFEFAMQFQGAMRVTRHELSNMLIEARGDGRAFAETYVYAFHVVERDGRVEDLVVHGRYLDSFERRNGEWRISARTELIDWAHERPATADWFDRQPPLNRGTHDMADALYAAARRDSPGA
ncbi:MAG: nuclear transport factor 2 family protein, partial [Gammaproteobacteria bacterium]|nr:nuclear transport factor 2 family protein [Gammaproteobacteria bacterium]